MVISGEGGALPMCVPPLRRALPPEGERMSFCDQMAAAIDGARTLTRLDHLSRSIWRGLTAGAVADDDAQTLAERLHARRRLVVCEKGCLGAQAGVRVARHALCRTTRAAQRRAHKALSQATRSRRLWPAAARMALIASPGAPNRRLRSTRPSLFRCPITGSMALRRRSSRRIVGETMPRVCVRRRPG